MRKVGTAFTAALMLALATAPGAYADAFHDVYKDYASTGKIDPCKYTSKQLKDARKQVPGDISQYAPDFPDALDAAAQQRAAGACDKKSGSSVTSNPAAAVAAATTGSGSTPSATTGATTGVVQQQPTTTIPAPVQTPSPTLTPQAQSTLPDATLAASTNESGNDDTPIPLILLAILVALALLAGAWVASVRYWAFDPPWMARTRHSVAEAGWRASAAWAEFTDWVRFGR